MYLHEIISFSLILGCIKDKRRAEKKDNLKEVAILCNSIGHIYAKYGMLIKKIRGEVNVISHYYTVQPH